MSVTYQFPRRAYRFLALCLDRSRLLSSLIVLAVILIPGAIASSGASATQAPLFQITVVDGATGRGVPLVELRTTNDVRWFTDSNGIAAIDEGGLMNQQVFFTVTSHGYTFPKDAFGYTGLKLDVKPGGRAKIVMQRVNIAERLYRLTGEGIYRDTLQLGLAAPTAHPILNGGVMGQDTVETTRYHGKLYWFYGDTARAAYPLGNFHTSGATSELPGSGGLNPEIGVDLNYFVDGSGFCKEMFTTKQPGPIWVGGLCTVRDESGAERLLCNYARMKSLDAVLERGLALFDDSTQQFQPVAKLDTTDPKCPLGHPFHATVGKVDHIYSAMHDSVPLPCVRVRADLKHASDPSSYEYYTCLKAGTKYAGSQSQIDRSPSGEIRYGWKTGTDDIGWKRQQELVKTGLIKAEEGLIQLRDADTDKLVAPASGSVYWNSYLHRWVMIMQQIGGDSLLGEVWFSCADTPVGPWVYARKIVSHVNYSFYNPTQHPYLDSDGGRRIYLEGTYTRTFTDNHDPTPRYEYNQIMYGLSLTDPRLALPVPVYREKANGAYGRAELLTSHARHADIEGIPFYACSPSHPVEGAIPIYEDRQGSHIYLSTSRGTSSPVGAAFYAIPVGAQKAISGALCPLYPYRNSASGEVIYDVNPSLVRDGFVRSNKPLCYVWRNPMAMLPLDWDTQP